MTVQEKFKIVVLDGYTLTADDFTWDSLEALAKCTVYDRSSVGEIVGRAQDANGVLINKVPLTAETIEQLPRLKYIGVTATGTNIVDLEACRAKNITVTNVPGYATPSVAQTVFSHLLNIAQHVAEHADAVRAGEWSTSPDFCFWKTPQVEIQGLTMGIVGYGSIGREVAKIADAFGMKVLINNRSPIQDAKFGQPVDLDTLFRTADVVSLHCPLTSETHNLVNRERLGLVKRSAILINTGRGQLIDEAALAEALSTGQIAAAGLDVLTIEPPSIDHPLTKLSNCFITPHIAWATRAARERLLDEVVNNVAAFLAGKPINVVT